MSAPRRIPDAEASEAAPQAPEQEALTRFGGRVGRDALIYGATGVISIVFGLVSVAVLTRLLPPAQYGHLAVYSFFMIILMVIYNLGSLQGTMSFVFGGGGDEDDDDGDDLLDPALITSGDRRRALGTGLTLTFLVSMLGTIPVWLLAPQLAPMVGHGSHSVGTIHWVAIGAVFAALWRLSGNVTRVERRPYSYAALHAAHPLITMSVSIPLLAAGYGVEGAVAGVALGNVVAFLVSLVVIRRSWRPAFSPRDAVRIYRMGGARVLVTMSTWLIHNGDLFMAAQYLGAAQVGLYRVGSRVGAVTSHWTSAFNMSYGPLRRDPLYLAASRESGTTTQATAGSYFVIVTVAIVLAMAVFARLLIHVAGSRYAAAASLIPLAAISFGSHGTFVLSYRLCTFHSRKKWFITLGVIALGVFVISGIFLTQHIGIYGPIAAAALAQMLAAAIMIIRNQLGEDPVPFQWWRMTRVLLAAGVAYLGFYAAEQAAPSGQPLFAPTAMLLFGLLLVATGAVPLAAIRNIVAMLRALRQTWAPRVVTHKLASLTEEDRSLLAALARDRVTAERVAEIHRVDAETIHTRLVEVLRRASGIERDGTSDARLGYYVLYRGAPANREVIARDLYADGVEPAELATLHFAYMSFRKAPRRVWAVAANAGRRAAIRAWTISALAGMQRGVRAEQRLIRTGGRRLARAMTGNRSSVLLDIPVSDKQLPEGPVSDSRASIA